MKQKNINAAMKLITPTPEEVMFLKDTGPEYCLKRVEVGLRTSDLSLRDAIIHLAQADEVKGIKESLARNKPSLNDIKIIEDCSHAYLRERVVVGLRTSDMSINAMIAHLFTSFARQEEECNRLD